MPERLHPGVYVEEVSSGVRPIEGVSTSVAAFLGKAQRGQPEYGHFLDGYEDYQRKLGETASGPDGFLPEAVAAFFAAGGRKAYVIRVMPDDAKRALTSTLETRSHGLEALTFHPKGKGAWSHSLRISLEDSKSLPDTRFRLIVSEVRGGLTDVLEIHEELSMNPNDENYVVEYLEDNSDLITAEDKLQAQLKANPVAEVKALLSTKSDGDFTIYEGSRVRIQSSNAADTSDPNVAEITFIANLPLASGADPARLNFTNREAEIDADQLKFLLANNLEKKDGTTSTDFDIDVVGSEVTLAPKVKTPGKLKLAKSGSPKWLLKADAASAGKKATVVVNGLQSTITHDRFPADATGKVEVGGEDIAKAIDSDIGHDPSIASVTLDGQTIVISFHQVPGVATAADDSTNDVAQVNITLDDGSGTGYTGFHHDHIRISIVEVPKPGLPRMLPDWGVRALGRGYARNNPENPVLRPQNPTEALRFSGGDDGKEALDPEDYRRGLRALDKIDVNMVAMPGQNEYDFIVEGITYCDGRDDCFYIADGPGDAHIHYEADAEDARRFAEAMPNRSKNAAVFYPWLRVTDPTGVGRSPTRYLPPSGHIAGVFARTDIRRGVWKAPAGIEAVVNALDLQYKISDSEQDLLNPIGMNCIRQFPKYGIVTWGSRTLSSDPEWRYIPVRRMALFLKKSLQLGLRWAVFEPNDEELWNRIRTNITAFMLSLFREGAFQGSSPSEAFYVKCDRSTNPQERIDQGIVTAEVAFAPLKPAEFVVIRLSQKSLLTV